MMYVALSEEAVRASADAARAWADVMRAWGRLSQITNPEAAMERWSTLAEAGARAQMASFRAASLAGGGARLASTPFGVTGLFASAPPAAPSRRTPAAAPSPGAFQALAKPLGRADDLTRIKGVGPKMQAKLNALGVFHFWQLASLSKPEAERLDATLAASGRVARDAWIAQAKKLAEDVPA